MELKDLFITPIWIVIIYAIANALKPVVTDKRTERYYITGLTVKIIGALGLGCVYQFYYGYGGDTFFYFQNAKPIFESFINGDIGDTFSLIFTPRQFPYFPSTYAASIGTYASEPEFFIVRIIGFFSLITFHTYSAIAVIFAFITFSGVWAMYKAIYRLYPYLHKKLAIAILFIPSVFFWGSGILKDPITLGALCWATWAFLNLFKFKRRLLFSFIALSVALFIIYTVKVYILICFLPCAIFWIFLERIANIKNTFLKFTLAPFILLVGVALSGVAATSIGSGSSKYSFDKWSETAEATAWWISYSSDLSGGSTYSLGDLDYSPSGVAKKALPAIWVSLFRPHLWEVRNPIMLLSAIESLAMLFITVQLIRKFGFKSFKHVGRSPLITFMFVFSILFAFTVGLTTYNFGSLVRYKIPLIPFYIGAIYLIEFEERLSRIKEKIRLERKRI